MISMASDRLNAIKHLDELKTKRWSFVTLSLVEDQPKIIIVDKPALEANLAEEIKTQDHLTNINNTFASLDFIFSDISMQLPDFIKPTLQELKAYQQTLKNEIFTVSTKLREDLGFRMQSSKHKGQSVDEILSDASWTEYKAGCETHIANIQNKVELCEIGISQINQILK
jgi:hypothetical protein